jgi:5-methylcytosine-specific restriction endonuclease McrA
MKKVEDGLTPQQRWRMKNPEKARAAVRLSARRRKAADPEAYRAKQRKWFADNREYARELWRRSYRKNIDKKLAAAKIKRERNRDKALAYAREWRKRNPERGKAAIALWRKENADRIRALNHNYRARKKNANGSSSAEAIAARIEYYGGLCAYCGVDFAHLDHAIPLSRGGTHWPANIYPACEFCNSSKKDKTPAEFRAYIAAKRAA